MIAQETVRKLRYAPLAERLWIIEFLLQSLKQELPQSKPKQQARKPFRVRTFNLVADIHVDREEMYAERGIVTLFLCKKKGFQLFRAKRKGFNFEERAKKRQN